VVVSPLDPWKSLLVGNSLGDIPVLVVQ